MSKASVMRLVAGGLGVVATGLVLNAVDGILWSVLTIVAGFVLSSLAAEAAFRRFAEPDEVRRDLDDRLRNSD